jgi:hypothetical protein
MHLCSVCCGEAPGKHGRCGKRPGQRNKPRDKQNKMPAAPPRSGRGGRRFKSCHSDQLHKQGADRPHLLANIEHLEARQVHKSVHRRVLRMVKLRQDNTGKYIARKRLPNDVREEYGRRHKAHHEAKFSAPASDGPHIAKQKFREWDAAVTARIEAIRAERKGEGISLTRQQARALAGEWYHWFIARHPTTDLEQWDAVRERVHEALRDRLSLLGPAAK